jgi:phage/plasmid-associated DNA primase
MNTLDRADWAAVNKVDYIALWKGIDENLEKGYSTDTVRIELDKLQEELKAEDIVDAFIEETGLRPVAGGTVKHVSRQELYSVYELWGLNNGVGKTTAQWMTMRLINKGFKSYKEKKKRIFEVNSEASVGMKHMLEVAK